MERIDELLFPTAALREALVNAFCHRDYAICGGAVNVAVFDDRVEIWSDGTLPFGIRPRDLTREHASKPRNPDITNVFYRRGLIEQWGRGTNRIVELTLKAGHPAPEFEEIAGSVVARFRPKTGSINPKIAAQAGTRQAQVTEQVTEQVGRILAVVQIQTLSGSEIMKRLRLAHRPTFLYGYVQPAMQGGMLEMTIPDKPRSRLQKYRLTENGRAWLAASKVSDKKK